MSGEPGHGADISNNIHLLPYNYIILLVTNCKWQMATEWDYGIMGYNRGFRKVGNSVQGSVMFEIFVSSLRLFMPVITIHASHFNSLPSCPKPSCFLATAEQ